MVIKRSIIILGLLLSMATSSACQGNIKQVWQKSESDQDFLILVEIVFADGTNITGYVKDLGVEEHSKVFIGGSSVSNLYDTKGNIIGCYNYHHVLYMKVLPEPADTNKKLD